jgi:hypothetical protein
MSTNELLVWMSARGQGSWQQFRAAVEELQLAEGNGSQGTEDDSPAMSVVPRYQILRLNFERLGHAEFFAGASPSGWRVTPPTLAAAEGQNGWRATLVGARTPKLLQRLNDATEKYSLQTTRLDDYPDQIVISNANADALALLARRAGLLFQHSAPLAILTNLPAIDDPSLRQSAELPIGSEWVVERFSISTGRWINATRQDAEKSSGLFRFSLNYRRVIVFCSHGRAFQLPTSIAKYLLLFRRRRRVLQYNLSSRILSIPATYRPPLLIERALILCAAVPPSYETQTGHLHYAEISRSVGELATALLRQEFK